MFHIRGWVLFAILLLVLPLSFAVDEMVVTTTETGKITNYFNEYYVVNVNGSIDFYNPSNYTITGGVFVPDLLGLVFLDTANTTYYNDGRIVIPELLPFEHVVMPYKIVGITNINPTLPGYGVLYSGFMRGKFEVTSDFYGELYKAPFEDSAYTGNANQRLISVKLENPTTLDFLVSTIKIIKTDSIDPNDPVNEWEFVTPDTPMLLRSGEVYAKDFLDDNAFEGDVYWLVTDVNLADVRFVDVQDIVWYTEEDLEIPYEILNYTNITDNYTNRTLLTFEGISLRKLVDKNLVSPGDTISLSLILNNFDNLRKEYSVRDEIPIGFSVESLGGGTVSGDRISFEGYIDPKNAVAMKYVLRFVDENLFGVDYFPPAYAVSAQKTVYSNAVSFVRQYVPEKRVFVQKRLLYLDDEQVQVNIELRNLGDGDVDGLVLKEFLDVNDLFSQISVPPKDKGVWDVEKLKSGETWQVTYVTTEIESLSKMPQVYGVDQTAILRSLVMENVMESGLVFASTHIIEIFGIVLIFLLPIIYHIINRHHQKLKAKKQGQS